MTTSTKPTIIATRSEMRTIVRAAQSAGKSVGVVMTMGALHAGHNSLVAECCATSDVAIVTIFVNPTQFLPGEDFEKYPRDLEGDLATMDGHEVDYVFAPTPEEMYGDDFSTYIEPPRVAQPLEGVHRPGHYRGVCTVVFKLLQAVPAEIAFFGHKDYQQYLVIKKMAADLDLPSEIRVCETVREKDGLALSSRNRYLSSAERERALGISRGLNAAAKKFEQGERNPASLRKEISKHMEASGIEKNDYVAVVDARTLEEIPAAIETPAIALVAAHVGTTRLIDNTRLQPPAV